MQTGEIVDMILEALRAMAIGIPGVFLVLAVFYLAVKLMMKYGKKDADDNAAAKSDTTKKTENE